MHSPGALARRGGAPVTGLATPRLRTGCVVFVCRPPAKGQAPEWVVRGGLGGINVQIHVYGHLDFSQNLAGRR